MTTTYLLKLAAALADAPGMPAEHAERLRTATTADEIRAACNVASRPSAVVQFPLARAVIAVGQTAGAMHAIIAAFAAAGLALPAADRERERAESFKLQRDGAHRELIRLADVVATGIGWTGARDTDTLAGAIAAFRAADAGAQAVAEAVAAERERVLAILRGAERDYGGGHHYDGMMDAYKHGLNTAVRCMESYIETNGGKCDCQLASLESIGRAEVPR